MKEGSQEFQAKMVTGAKMDGPEHLDHQGLWVKEDFPACRGFQVLKVTGVFQASTVLKATKVFQVKKGQMERQEDKGYQDLSAQPDHEGSEAETGPRGHREYEELMVCLGHQDQRVLSGAQAHQDSRGRQE